ncbi:MAG: hypothetical protein IJC88_06200 [Oscillospiraceae bacterium]|nr:hypothetical protein [Oscillospiraceae bacterium]
MLKLYADAYAALSTVTPIPADCGMLCQNRCCHGDEDHGMILFPGEAEFLGITCKTREMNGMEVGFFTCNGTCRRNRRPLSCRIYPYAPYFKDGVLTVLPDPRAKYVCPLLSEDAIGFIQADFLTAIKTAFTVLLQSPEISDMLVRYSEMLDEYKKFTEKEW